MPFDLRGFAILHAITIGSAGGAENPQPYVTLKVEADQQPIDSVAAAVGAADRDLPALRALHDTADELLPPRLIGVTSIDTWYESRGRHTLTYAGIRTRVAKVSAVRIKIAPRGCWTIACNLGIDELPQSTLDRLAQLLKGNAKILLEQDPELDLRAQQTVNEMRAELRARLHEGALAGAAAGVDVAAELRGGNATLTVRSGDHGPEQPVAAAPTPQRKRGAATEARP